MDFFRGPAFLQAIVVVSSVAVVGTIYLISKNQRKNQRKETRGNEKTEEINVEDKISETEELLVEYKNKWYKKRHDYYLRRFKLKSSTSGDVEKPDDTIYSLDKILDHTIDSGKKKEILQKYAKNVLNLNLNIQNSPPKMFDTIKNHLKYKAWLEALENIRPDIPDDQKEAFENEFNMTENDLSKS